MIAFSKEEKEINVRKIQLYFKEEVNQEMGSFDVQFLLDFFAEEVGAYFYNRGLYDAWAILERRLESISEAIYELEKPTDFRNKHSSNQLIRCHINTVHYNDKFLDFYCQFYYPDLWGMNIVQMKGSPHPSPLPEGKGVNGTVVNSLNGFITSRNCTHPSIFPSAYARMGCKRAENRSCAPAGVTQRN